MDDIAQLPAEERSEIFTEAAARMNVAPIIIEKDFWVCWTLKRVFSLSDLEASLIFKGGTSLSKAYGVIRRFSEDIDLSLDRRDLGFDGDRDPARDGLSNKTRKALLEELSVRAEHYIQGELMTKLSTAMRDALPSSEIDLTVSEEDSQTLIFNYPASLTTRTGDYLADKVKLEFGARSDHLPAETRMVKPYAAKQLPDLFKEPDVEVKVLSAARTFWEKATILHMLFHQKPDKALGRAMSRHYYDLAALADTPIKAEALNDLDLLKAVAQHKSLLFRAAWARYETARPPDLRLLPNPDLNERLRRDYSNMREMLFDDGPKWYEIINSLEALEAEINAL